MFTAEEMTRQFMAGIVGGALSMGGIWFVVSMARAVAQSLSKAQIIEEQVVSVMSVNRRDPCPRCATEIAHGDGLVDECPHCKLVKPLSFPPETPQLWLGDDARENCWAVLGIVQRLEDCPNANWVEAKYIRRLVQARTENEIIYVMRAWEECGRRMNTTTLRFSNH